MNKYINFDNIYKSKNDNGMNYNIYIKNNNININDIMKLVYYYLLNYLLSNKNQNDNIFINTLKQIYDYNEYNITNNIDTTNIILDNNKLNNIYYLKLNPLNGEIYNITSSMCSFTSLMCFYSKILEEIKYSYYEYFVIMYFLYISKNGYIMDFTKFNEYNFIDLNEISISINDNKLSLINKNPKSNPEYYNGSIIFDKYHDSMKNISIYLNKIIKFHNSMSIFDEKFTINTTHETIFLYNLLYTEFNYKFNITNVNKNIFNNKKSESLLNIFLLNDNHNDKTINNTKINYDLLNNFNNNMKSKDYILKYGIYMTTSHYYFINFDEKYMIEDNRKNNININTDNLFIGLYQDGINKTLYDLTKNNFQNINDIFKPVLLYYTKNKSKEIKPKLQISQQIKQKTNITLDMVCNNVINNNKYKTNNLLEYYETNIINISERYKLYNKYILNCLFYNNNNNIISSIIKIIDINKINNDIDNNLKNLIKIDNFDIKYYFDILKLIYNSILLRNGNYDLIEQIEFRHFIEIKDNEIFKPSLDIIKDILCSYYKLTHNK
jgi:hypothetical protein